MKNKNRKKYMLFLMGIGMFCILFTGFNIFACAQASVVYHGVATEPKRIALTFDDGPHPKQTKEILDLLEEYQVHATFFQIGSNVKYYGEKLVPEILSKGHEIGNHSYSHICGRTLSEDEWKKEINSSEEAIFQLSGYRTKLFRPPGGAFDEKTRQYCDEHGYSIVLWSVDTKDWKHREPDAIVKEVLSSVKSGDIILMHDYIGGHSPTLEVLKKLVPALIQQGYEFCTVSELISE